MNFQELIKRLNDFWSQHGVLIAQPYGIEVAAGTANPHTFFRVLGPEPYNVAYVEPCRRPADGMYGLNPNRLQHYYQYQIILKPAPRFNTYLYMQMLEHLGIDPTNHDLRFVEDNWESPSLGAWGVGWEIWLDGMEVTQYTYFQQVAGIPLEVPALEITLGLERLAMYLQDKEHYKDILWNDNVPYGALFSKHEYYQSKFNYEDASIDRAKKLYEIYKQEALKLLEKQNYWAAYDMLLKMSHVFNILDARGAISYNKRVASFKEMAKIVNKVATIYLKERKKLGYPLKQLNKALDYKPKEATWVSFKQKHSIEVSVNEKEDIYVLELGFEELPTWYLEKVFNILTRDYIKEHLKEYGIEEPDISVILTPQRIGFIWHNALKEVTLEQEVKGLPYKVAYKDGKPTKALSAWLKKYGLLEADITWKNEKKGKIAYAKVVRKIPLSQIVMNLIEGVFGKIQAPYARWDSSSHTFVRPLRWIYSQFNSELIPISYLGVKADTFTSTPRFAKPHRIRFYSADEYLEFKEYFDLYLEPAKRLSFIKKESSRYGFNKDDSMVLENLFLVESPKLLYYILDKKYDTLPFELVEAILSKNQRFLVYTDGNNKNVRFIVVANQHINALKRAEVLKNISTGYLKVTTARLDDGLFYFKRDTKKDLKEYRAKLQKIPFSLQSGSYYNKVLRLNRLANHFADAYSLNLSSDFATVLSLVKNDLATYLGNEYPELEGIIASSYAGLQGYNKNVVRILRDYVNVKPKTFEGWFLAFLDTLDSVATLIQEVDIDKLGSKDPYFVKKHISRLISLLTIKNKLTPKINLVDIFRKAENILTKQGLTVQVLAERIAEVVNKRFIKEYSGHLELSLLKAIAFNSSDNLFQKYSLIKMLQALDSDKLRNMLTVLKRVHNILKKANLDDIKSRYYTQELLTEYEQELYNFVIHFPNTPDEFIEKIDELSKLLERFFDNVLVFSKNEGLRKKRVALLKMLDEKLSSFVNIEKLWD